MTKTRKFVAIVAFMAMVLNLNCFSAFAEESSLAAGTYDVSDYVELSLYVNAMGGIDFANGMLEGASLTVDANGDATLAISLGTSSGVIYTVKYVAFVDSTYVPGYFDEDGELQYCNYTVSSKTATNPDGDEVNYIDSMTFPVSVGTEIVDLWVYVNSNVMGLQFCDGSGTLGSNNPGLYSQYEGYISLDWNAILTAYGSGSTGSSSSSYKQGADITYTYEEPEPTNEFVVSIPSTIPMGTETSASYKVELTEADLADDAYVTVTAPTSGTLTCGDASLTFSNTLESGELTSAGDSLAGSVALTQEASVGGDYTGTLTFTISLYTE